MLLDTIGYKGTLVPSKYLSVMLVLLIIFDWIRSSTEE